MWVSRSYPRVNGVRAGGGAFGVVSELLRGSGNDMRGKMYSIFWGGGGRREGGVAVVVCDELCGCGESSGRRESV